MEVKLRDRRLKKLRPSSSVLTGEECNRTRKVMACAGSLEHLPMSVERPNDIHESSSLYRIEDGESQLYKGTCGNPVHLEEPESQTRWYFKYFLGKEHRNYVGFDNEKLPFFVSVVSDTDNAGFMQCRAILWHKEGCQKMCIPWKPRKGISPKGILRFFSVNNVDKPHFKQVLTPSLQKQLLQLEEQEGAIKHKFGVIYARPGQTRDDEMLCNENGNEAFDTFVNLLGDKIKLENWKKYRGGLDVKTNTTGEYCHYTVHEGREIIFHVSTLLPYEPLDKQQIERKRHIGNDIVVIVFQDVEGEERPTFKPTGIRSHFTHVFALVTYSKSDNTYKLAVYSYNNVPLFGPPLHSPPTFSNHQDFRDFLLIKLINGEKAAYHIPVFAEKRKRTLEALIRSMYQELIAPELTQYRLFSHSPFPTTESKRKREDFLQYGTALKIDIINNGSAPSGTASSRPRDRKQPWLPQRVCCDFPHSILCGDSWGDSLVAATESGVFLIEGDSVYQEIINLTVIVDQLDIIESHQLLFLRAHYKGKDVRPCLHIIKLNECIGSMAIDTDVKGVEFIKNYRVEVTRGCHLYTLNQSAEGNLKIAVAIKTRVLIMTVNELNIWKHDVHIPPQKLVNCFTIRQDLTLHQEPSLMSIIHGFQSEPDMLCVGYKEHFEIVDEQTGNICKIHRVEAAGQFEEIKFGKRHKRKPINLVSPVNVYDEEGKPEIFLTGNNVSFLLGIDKDVSYHSSYYWNHPPLNIVCAYPYLLGFACNDIEIRLVVNGFLVQSITVPEINLITSKFDVYYTTPPTRSSSLNSNGSQAGASQRSAAVAIYRIPIMSLLGDELYMSRIKSASTTIVGNSVIRPPKFGHSLVKSGPYRWRESHALENNANNTTRISREFHRIA